MENQVILLVEDNRDDEDLTLCALRQSGITNSVIVARNGAEALALLLGDPKNQWESPPLRPALVLMDLKLPKVSGLEVLQQIRAHEQTKLLPVVILTTSREERDLYESYRLHANSYIQKPIDFAQFVKIMGYLVLYWLSLNEPPPVTEGCQWELHSVSC